MPPSVSLRKLSTQVCDTGNRQKPVRALDSISESNSRQAISRHNRVREKATATARGSGAWRSDFNANGVQQLDEHFIHWSGCALLHDRRSSGSIACRPNPGRRSQVPL